MDEKEEEEWKRENLEEKMEMQVEVEEEKRGVVMSLMSKIELVVILIVTDSQFLVFRFL